MPQKHNETNHVVRIKNGGETSTDHCDLQITAVYWRQGTAGQAAAFHSILTTFFVYIFSKLHSVFSLHFQLQHLGVNQSIWQTLLFSTNSFEGLFSRRMDDLSLDS